jgi:3-methyladenine DNA glycosylase Mpg
MARRAALLLAVLAGLVAAVLLGSDVSVQHQGETVSCTTVITAAAADSGHRLDACHAALVRRTELAGLGGLVCVAAATAYAFGGRPRPDYVGSAPTRIGTAGA